MSASPNKRKKVGLAEKLQASEKVFHSKITAAQNNPTHPSVQARKIENLWIELLRQYLPLRYKIDRGFVVDSNGKVSDQIDCIVYDALYTPRLYGGDDDLCVPAESVYAVFESNPYVSKEDVKYAVKKVDSVRALQRKKAAVVVDRGEAHASREPFKIIGGLLTSSLGIKEATAKGHFQKLDLDCILVSDENSPSYLDKFQGKVSSSTGLITGIFRLLQNLQSLGTVPPINWEAYEKAIHTGKPPTDRDSYHVSDIRRVRKKFGLSWDESEAVLSSWEKFAEPFKLLSQYDNRSVELPHQPSVEDDQNMVFADEEEWARVGREFYKLKSEQAYRIVNFIKQKIPENRIFGIELESGKFAGIVDCLYQNVYGQVLYPTPIAKATHLLYFVIKDHPFCDGNKRIAIFLFSIFLEMHTPDFVEETIGHAAMSVLALLIAVSDPQDKEMVVNLVMRVLESSKQPS